MEIVFLGTGNAFAAGGRSPLAIFVRAADFGLLLDCGPSTLVTLKSLELSAEDIDLVLLSHHHGDHFGGVPFLVLDGHYRGRSRPLTVAGPPGTDRLLRSALELFFPGIEEAHFPLGYRDLTSGVTDSEAFPGLRITPFEVDHFSRGTAFGYRLSFRGKTIVYSGDSGWTEVLAEQSRDADLFICECSSFDEPLKGHLSHGELSRHRDRLAARRTLLVHPGEDVLAHESELVFELAKDRQRIEL